MTPAHRALSLVSQLGRVGSNRHQLRRLAEIDGDGDGVRVLTAAGGMVEYAISAAPSKLGARGDVVIAAVVEAGNGLNALAHRANTAEQLPPMPELRTVPDQVEAAVRDTRAVSGVNAKRPCTKLVAGPSLILVGTAGFEPATP